MKTNRKNEIEMSDSELRKIFSEHFEGDQLERHVSDARKAWTYLSKNPEFNK